MAAWVLAFAMGVLLGVTGGTGLCVVLGPISVGAAALLVGRRWWTLATGCLVFGLGQAHGWREHDHAQRREQAVSALAAGGSLCAVGRVTEVVAVASTNHEEGGPEAERFYMRGNIEQAGPSLQGDSVRLSVFRLIEEGVDDAVAVGDSVHTCGAWQPPFGFFNPGAGAGWPQLALRKDVGSLRAQHVTVVDRASPWWPWQAATLVRDALSRTLHTLPTTHAAFLRATVLGERSAVGPDIELGFKAAGATHALSVSGLHLAAVAALFFVGIKRLLLMWPRAVQVVPVVPLAAAVSIPAIVFYTLITGEAVATWRSALMACCVFAGYALRRAPAVASSLALAAGLILLQSAYWLWDVSFQLSVISVMGLAVFATRLSPAPTLNHNTVSWCLNWLGKGCAATAAAGLLTAPLVAYHFSELTPAAPLGNLVLTPLVELCVVPLGLLGAGITSIFPVTASVFLWPANVAAGVTMSVAVWFATWAPVWKVNPPVLWATAALTAAMACALWAAAASGVTRRKWLYFAGLLCLCAAGSWQFRLWLNQHRDSFRVTFLDVGQGDAAVVQGPDGFVAVIDGGGIGGTFDTGQRLVEPFLRAEGISRIDLVVLSHPHPDHASGLFAVLKGFDVASLWMPAGAPTHEGGFIENLTILAKTHGAAVPTPQEFTRGRLLVQPLGPWDGDKIGAPEGLSVNDASLSVRFSFGKGSILFAGDLEGPGEVELAERKTAGLADPASDILKVPHHGSRTSSSAELLDAVRPRMAVISAGRGNRFGFPHAEVLARYRARGIQVLRTDNNGAVQLEWSAESPIKQRCWRGDAACAEGF